jgi:hypothetical protein
VKVAAVNSGDYADDINVQSKLANRSREIDFFADKIKEVRVSIFEKPEVIKNFKKSAKDIEDDIMKISQ